MSLYDDAVLVMIPSAFKATKLYSAKPTDAAGDFTVANAGTKFRTNSDLMLEEIAIDVPALDYSAVGGCPTLKLNDENTNLLERPLSFGNSYWDKSGSTIEGDITNLGADIITGTDSDFSGAGNWLNFGMATFDVNSTVAGKAYVLGNGNQDQIYLLSVMTVGKIYNISLKARLNTGASTTIRAGASITIDSPNNHISLTPTGTEGTFSGQFIASAVNLSIGVHTIDGGMNGIAMEFDDISLNEVAGYPSPSVTYPTDAYLFTATATDGSIKLATPLASAAYNNSWYVKRATGTGVVSLIDASDTDIEIAVTGGWQRFDANATGTQCGLKLATSGDAVYIAFAQTSAKTYAPTFTYEGTEGATSSMLADAITDGGDAATFASVNASGVLYAEIATIEDNTGHDNIISINGGNGQNRIYIQYKGSGEQIRWGKADSRGSGDTFFKDVSLTSRGTFKKVAIRWAVNDFSLWIDGIGIDTQAAMSTFLSSTLTDVSFDYNNAGAILWVGNAKQVAVYNYLDDAAMETLTTP